MNPICSVGHHLLLGFQRITWHLLKLIFDWFARNFVPNFVSKNAVMLGVFPVFCKQKLG